VGRRKTQTFFEKKRAVQKRKICEISKRCIETKCTHSLSPHHTFMTCVCTPPHDTTPPPQSDGIFFIFCFNQKFFFVPSFVSFFVFRRNFRFLFRFFVTFKIFWCALNLFRATKNNFFCLLYFSVFFSATQNNEIKTVGTERIF